MGTSSAAYPRRWSSLRCGWRCGRGIVIGAAFAVIAFGASWGGIVREGPPVASRGQASQLYYFSSLAQMTATSDAIVEATVLRVTPGRTLVYAEDGTF